MHQETLSLNTHACRALPPGHVTTGVYILQLAQDGVRSRVAQLRSSPTGCRSHPRNQPSPGEPGLSGRGGRAVLLLGHAVNTAPLAGSAGARDE